jgi:flagellar basal-body rod protein FlgF
MENAQLVGLSRQMVLQRELDVIANNLANLNTTGFKGEGAKFEEYVMPGARAGNITVGDASLKFVQDRRTWHDLSQGTIQQTGNPLDVAVDGDGFLVVQTPAGERYTRNGALQMNAAGELVTSEGHRVLGEGGQIAFQQQDAGIAIARDGTISVMEGRNTSSSSVRGKLRLVNFANPQALRKDGASTFSAPAGVTPAAAPVTTTVVQGSIEKSNVRSVVEMTRMIEVTRTYTTVATMLQQQSDLRRSAIEQLAQVPA